MISKVTCHSGDGQMDRQRTVELAGAGVALVADAYGHEDGPTVLFLHGGGQTRHAWGTAATVLAASGRYAVSVDLRGHGDSEWAADGDYTIGSFASDVVEVASGLRRPLVIVGASLGGLASLVALGQANDDLADALVLVDVTPKVKEEGAERIRGFMLEGMSGFERLEDAAEAISAFIPNRPRPRDLSGLSKNLRQQNDGRWYWHWDPRSVVGPDGKPPRGAGNYEQVRAAAGRVRVPTLLVRGRMSDIVTEEGVRELQMLIPHVEVVDVSGAGHMVAGDRNDAFNTAILEFVHRVIPPTAVQRPEG